MNQERKVSVLRNLLERVQKRAGAPRIAAAPMAAEPLTPASSALPLAISAPPPQPGKSSGRPGSSTLPLNFASSPEAASFRPPAESASEPPAQMSSAPTGAISDRSAPPELEGDAEQGPPSAPRLREAPEEEEAAAEEREIEEEEPQIKTPPPESGKQHVTPGPTAPVSEPDEDISITVTMEESEVPPSVESEPPAAVAAPAAASARAEIPEVSGPQPRLALVSEPEIELHGMTPLSGMAEVLPQVISAKPPAAPELQRSAPGAPFRPQELDLAIPVAPSVPAATPSGVRPVPPAPAAPAPPAAAPLAPPAAFAKTVQSVPDTKPSVSVPAEPVEAPPARLMAQPLADGSGKPQPPVEVWASTFAPAALRGQVASFVGQNASFEPKTFGELLRASLSLGEEKP